MNETIKEYLYYVMKELEQSEKLFIDEEDEEFISVNHLETILFRCINKVGGSE